jgi:hypothetical protein
VTASLLLAALAGGGLAGGPAHATAALVVVDQSSWTDTAGQVHLIGDIRNDGAPVEGVHTVLDLLDASGQSLATVTTYTLSETLNTGADRPFEAVLTPPAGFSGRFIAETPTGTPATQPEPDVLDVEVTATDPTHQTADALEGTVTNTSGQDLVGAEIGAIFYDAAGHLVLVSYAPAQDSANNVALPAHSTSVWSLPWVDGSPTWSTYRVSAETSLSDKTPGTGPGAAPASGSTYPTGAAQASTAPKRAAGDRNAGLLPASRGLPRTLKPSVQPPPVHPAGAVSTAILSAPPAAATAPAGKFAHDSLLVGAGVVAAAVALALLRRFGGGILRRRGKT